MVFLKSLVLNFLIVFFSNHILPGILVINQTKLPHVGSDFIFAFSLGLLNACIYPVLKLFQGGANLIKIVLVALVLNLTSYAVIKFVPPAGVQINTIEGYIMVVLAVTLGSVLTNLFEMKKSRPAPPHSTDSSDE